MRISMRIGIKITVGIGVSVGVDVHATINMIIKIDMSSRREPHNTTPNSTHEAPMSSAKTCGPPKKNHRLS